jgi:hypothetical protein
MIQKKTEKEIELENKLIDFLDSNKIPPNEGISSMFTICLSGLHASGTELSLILNIITDFYKRLDGEKNKND